MKKGHFLWSAHRITEKQKAGKARNTKENSFQYGAVRSQGSTSCSSVLQALILESDIWFTPVCPNKRIQDLSEPVFRKVFLALYVFDIIRTGMAEPSGSGIPVLVCDMQFMNYRTPNLVPRLSVPLLFHSV